MKKSITPIGTPVGIDVHKRRCKVVELQKGKVQVRKSIANTREDWRELLTELPPDAEIGLEVSTAGYFAMSVLEEAGWRERSHWIHTAGIDSNRRQKNDRLDAERLARKLAAHHLDPLPEAWFPPPEIRALRLRARAALLAGGTAHPVQKSLAKSAGDARLAGAGQRSVWSGGPEVARRTKAAAAPDREHPPDPAPAEIAGGGDRNQRAVLAGGGGAVPRDRPAADHPRHWPDSGAGDLE